MQTEVIKIGNATFLSQVDKSVIKRILNSDFDINDDFSGNRSKISFDAESVSTEVESGIQIESNQVVVNANPVKIYVAKYRKNSCDWDNIIYYGILDDYDSTIELDIWSHLYSNSQYCVYRIFSYALPITLPLNGSLPTSDNASFIKYEAFRNVWMRRQCKFKYANSVVSLVDTVGDDTWYTVGSGDEECLFEYTKSTPFGCNFYVPSTNDIQISEDCSCLDLLSSSSVSSSSSMEYANSSSSSESSDSTQSTESSSLDSSSSEFRMYPKNIDTLYLRIVGDPFVASQYVLKLKDADSIPIVWEATSHSSDTNSTGTISLEMNQSGRFKLSADLVVDGSRITIVNALLSNIRNDNFSYYLNYLKGISVIDSSYITNKYTSTDGVKTLNYDCIISYEKLKKNNGSPKRISEIIYDYEMAELSVDDNAEKVILFFGNANESDANDICRAWGLFCLNNESEGVWRYYNTDQEIKLSHTTGGCWTLYRKYINSSTSYREIEFEIDSKVITSNTIGEYGGFSGISVVPNYFIRGEVEDTDLIDVCSEKDSIVVFYSCDDCMQDVSYQPYSGELALTISSPDWYGKSSYILRETIISENLSVWSWSSIENKINNFEYAILFSNDGILWKLMLYKMSKDSKGYVFSEFIKNNNLNNFSPIFNKIHKSNISLNGEWSEKDATITISSIVS